MGEIASRINSRILGLGHCLPERVVTNQDLTRLMDTSDEWIRQRTGIRERRFIGVDTGPADLALGAATGALREAGVAAADLDLILLGTLSPDIDFPSSASLLQRHLGVRGMPAMDVRNQCSGFLYMLAVADAFIRTGGARRVLVAGAEVHSTGIDLSTAGREVAVIFGDGAAAAVLGPEPDPRRGVLSVHLHSEGRYAEKLMVDAPSSRSRPRVTRAMLNEPGSELWPKMEGRYVFKHAVTRVPEVVREALAANGCTVADLDLLIPHQANLRINQVVADALGLPEEKVFNNIERYGNTTAASIPLALHEAVLEGRLRPGMLVCLAGLGSGFTWAAALLRW
jgi:3-oxoacyl-[acyl-carrier-protein] synthase-3